MEDQLERYKKLLEDINREIAEHPENVSLLDDRERIKFMISNIGNALKDNLDQSIDTNDNLVNLNDELNVVIKYPNEEVEQMIIKVVNVPSNNPNEVSIESPLGMAIVGKEIGSIIEYETPVGTCSVHIMGRTSNRGR